MTVDARRPSPVDPVDLGVDRQESSELFGDMGDFGDLLGEMLAMERTTSRARAFRRRRHASGEPGMARHETPAAPAAEEQLDVRPRATRRGPRGVEANARRRDRGAARRRAVYAARRSRDSPCDVKRRVSSPSTSRCHHRRCEQSSASTIAASTARTRRLLPVGPHAVGRGAQACVLERVRPHRHVGVDARERVLLEHLRVERRILDLELARVGAAHRLRRYEGTRISGCVAPQFSEPARSPRRTRGCERERGSSRSPTSLDHLRGDRGDA